MRLFIPFFSYYNKLSRGAWQRLFCIGSIRCVKGCPTAYRFAFPLTRYVLTNMISIGLYILFKESSFWRQFEDSLILWAPVHQKTPSAGQSMGAGWKWFQTADPLTWLIYRKMIEGIIIPAERTTEPLMILHVLLEQSLLQIRRAVGRAAFKYALTWILSPIHWQNFG